MNTIRSAAVLVLLSLLATACSGDAGSDDAAPTNTVPEQETESTSSTTTSTTTSTTSSTTTSTTTTTVAEPEAELTDEEQIRILIEDYWRTFFSVANDPPNPDPALWEGIGAPNVVDDLVANVQNNLDRGVGVRAADPDSPFVVSLRTTVIEGFAIVFTCVRDEGETYDLSTGERLSAASGVSSTRQEAVLTPEGWRVEKVELLETFEGEGTEACVDSLP